jgi:hypothetical protein
MCWAYLWRLLQAQVPPSHPAYHSPSESPRPWPGQLSCAITAGGIAGIASPATLGTLALSPVPVVAACTCPLDVVKTRVQVGALSTSHGGARLGYRTAIQELLRREGPKGFFRGVGARVLWLAPASALNVTLYEVSSTWLGTIDNTQN